MSSRSALRVICSGLGSGLTRARLLATDLLEQSLALVGNVLAAVGTEHNGILHGAGGGVGAVDLT